MCDVLSADQILRLEAVKMSGGDVGLARTLYAFLAEKPALTRGTTERVPSPNVGAF